MAIVSLQEKHLVACSQLSATVFNREPWRENWTLETANARLSHFLKFPGFVGFGYGDPDLIGLILGTWEPWEDHKIFYLRELCIHPEHQNQGIGSQLMEHLVSYLIQINVHRITLMTRGDTPAEAFYLKNGFSHSRLTLMTKHIG